MKKKRLIILALLSIVSISIFITTHHFKERFFQDLRTRIAGTRLLDAHKSAYFYKWQIGDDIRLLNFTEKQTEIVNGNTVTPTVLFFTDFLHRLPYSQIVVIWYLLGYLALFSILLLLVLKMVDTKSTTNQILFAIACAFPFLVCWRLHCNSGQIYIYYSFFAIASFYLYTKEKFLAAAIFAGIVTAARLPYLIMFAPLFVFKKNNKMIVPYIATIAVLFAIPTLMYGTHVWSEYFKAMPYYGFENMGTVPKIRDEFTIALPRYLEGLPTFKTPGLEAYENWDKADIFSIQKLLIKLHLPSSAGTLYLLFSLFCIGLFLWVNKWNPKFYRQQKLLILFAALLMLILEYFLPALRFNYNFVQFLVIIGIMMFFDITMKKFAKCLLAAGILLNIFRINWIPECYSFGEVLCIAAVVITIIQYRPSAQFTANDFNPVGRLVDRLFTLVSK